MSVVYKEIGSVRTPMCELSFDGQDYIWLQQEEVEGLIKKLQGINYQLAKRRAEKREEKTAQHGGVLFR